ncbi:MAG: CoA transferase, partial [Comamonas sp.]
DGWLTLFITHDKFWEIFCLELGLPQWVDHPHFATMAARRMHRAEVVPAIAQVLQQAPASEWVRRLAPLGVVVAEVGTLNTALKGDIARSRELVVPLGDGSLPLSAVASPIRFDNFTPSYRLPPLLNEHAAELLGKDVTCW